MPAAGCHVCITLPCDCMPRAGYHRLAWRDAASDDAACTTRQGGSGTRRLGSGRAGRVRGGRAGRVRKQVTPAGCSGPSGRRRASGHAVSVPRRELNNQSLLLLGSCVVCGWRCASYSPLPALLCAGSSCPTTRRRASTWHRAWSRGETRRGRGRGGAEGPVGLGSGPASCLFTR